MHLCTESKLALREADARPSSRLWSLELSETAAAPMVDNNRPSNPAGLMSPLLPSCLITLEDRNVGLARPRAKGTGAVGGTGRWSATA